MAQTSWRYSKQSKAIRCPSGCTSSVLCTAPYIMPWHIISWALQSLRAGPSPVGTSHNSLPPSVLCFMKSNDCPSGVHAIIGLVARSSVFHSSLGSPPLAGIIEIRLSVPTPEDALTWVARAKCRPSGERAKVIPRISRVPSRANSSSSCPDSMSLIMRLAFFESEW